MTAADSGEGEDDALELGEADDAVFLGVNPANAFDIRAPAEGADSLLAVLATGVAAVPATAAADAAAGAAL